MTCNELITLCLAYRGLSGEQAMDLNALMGHVRDDLVKLHGQGLVQPAMVGPDRRIIPCPEGDMWTTTTKGTTLVEKCLKQGTPYSK